MKIEIKKAEEKGFCTFCDLMIKQILYITDDRGYKTVLCPSCVTELHNFIKKNSHKFTYENK